MEGDEQENLEPGRQMELILEENSTESNNGSEEGNLEVEQPITESSQEAESTQESSNATLSPSSLNVPGHMPVIINEPTMAVVPVSPLMFSQEQPLPPVGGVSSPVCYAEPDTSVPSPHDLRIDLEISDFSQDSTPEVSELIYGDMSTDEANVNILGVNEVASTSAEGNEVSVSETTSPSPAETVLLQDDREYLTWKKSIMLVYNRLISHRHASLFLRPVTEKQAPGYYSIVRRPMDLQTIRKNIKNGVIRTTEEFHRDVLLMFLNALMYNKRNGTVYNMAQEMLAASLEEIRVLVEAQQIAAARRAAQAEELERKRRQRDE